MDLPYAHEVNYWKSGSQSPDTIMDRATKLLAEVGAKVTERAQMWQRGQECFVIGFSLHGEKYRVVWPVLRTKSGRMEDQRAARRQAATFVFYDIKAKAMTAKVLGPEAAFIPYLLTDDGRTFHEMTSREAAGAKHLLPAPETPEPEYG